jgi:hypothetical protein
VPGGACTTRWYVRVNDAWTNAASHPSAKLDTLDCGAGTVWEHRIDLELAPGSLLIKEEKRPAARERRTPLEYLQTERRDAPRSVSRRTFTVGSDGELRLVPSR